MFDESGTSGRIENEFFQRLHDGRGLDVDPVDLPVDRAVAADDRRLGQVVESFCARVIEEAEVVAEPVDGLGIEREEVPARCTSDALIRGELAHALRRVDFPVEPDRRDSERIAAERVLSDADSVRKILRDHRANVVAARIDHADDERPALELRQLERLTIGIAEREIGYGFPYRILAERQRILAIILLRPGEGPEKCAGHDTSDYRQVRQRACDVPIVSLGRSRHNPLAERPDLREIFPVHEVIKHEREEEDTHQHRRARNLQGP